MNTFPKREGGGSVGPAETSSGFTHSVILGSMLPIHKRFPSCATLSEMMEAFSTVPAADDMCTLCEAGTEDREIRYSKKKLTFFYQRGTIGT